MEYYYTDPLAACYMMRTYLMQICRDAQCNKPWRFRNLMGQIEYTTRGKFYIHPDSLSLLKPEVGDIILDDEKVPYCIGMVTNEIWQDGEIGIDWGSGIGRLPLTDNQKIIQRKGQAFFWPEKKHGN